MLLKIFKCSMAMDAEVLLEGVLFGEVRSLVGGAVRIRLSHTKAATVV